MSIKETKKYIRQSNNHLYLKKIRSTDVIGHITELMSITQRSSKRFQDLKRAYEAMQDYLREVEKD